MIEPAETRKWLTFENPSELEKLGFGRYQQCIWLLCGFGYFLDLTWSKGVGLMATAL